MLVTEMLNTCKHESVAEAAVASIGGSFADLVRTSAEAQGRSVGWFAAEKVRLFSRFATERDWRLLTQSMHGEDLPVLTGLETVMARMMGSGKATGRDLA